MRLFVAKAKARTRQRIVIVDEKGLMWLKVFSVVVEAKNIRAVIQSERIIRGVARRSEENKNDASYVGEDGTNNLNMRIEIIINLIGEGSQREERLKRRSIIGKSSFNICRVLGRRFYQSRRREIGQLLKPALD